MICLTISTITVNSNNRPWAKRLVLVAVIVTYVVIPAVLPSFSGHSACYSFIAWQCIFLCVTAFIMIGYELTRVILDDLF